MSANAIDLTTVANVKSWAQVQTSGDDQTIQDAITAFSLFALHVTGRGNADGSVPAASPFNSVVSYDEFYDGNGNNELPLRNWPIASVTSVTDTGVAVQSSSSTTSPGFVIDQSKKFLVLRGGTNAYRGFRGGWSNGKCGWSLGTQNIEVAYTAGFAATPFDLEMLARKVVALNYKRRSWIGQKSQAMAQGAGTLSFNDWEMDAEDKRVLMFYQVRTA